MTTSRETACVEKKGLKRLVIYSVDLKANVSRDIKADLQAFKKWPTGYGRQTSLSMQKKMLKVGRKKAY